MSYHQRTAEKIDCPLSMPIGRKERPPNDENAREHLCGVKRRNNSENISISLEE